jgi:hypothetical protein
METGGEMASGHHLAELCPTSFHQGKGASNGNGVLKVKRGDIVRSIGGDEVKVIKEFIKGIFLIERQTGDRVLTPEGLLTKII